MGQGLPTSCQAQEEACGHPQVAFQWLPVGERAGGSVPTPPPCTVTQASLHAPTPGGLSCSWPGLSQGCDPAPTPYQIGS